MYIYYNEPTMPLDLYLALQTRLPQLLSKLIRASAAMVHGQILVSGLETKIAPASITFSLNENLRPFKLFFSLGLVNREGGGSLSNSNSTSQIVCVL